MKLAYLLQNLDLVGRNRDWLSAPVPTSIKLGFYPRLALSYAALLGYGHRRIGYLGRPFLYDNPATPLNLQVYPYEVGVKVLGRIPERPATVLDIGANIGQFARTLAYLLPDATIDSFELNPAIFAMLQQNTAGTNIRPFNQALGPLPGTATFYYEPNRSGVGSFIRANAGNQANIREIGVSIADSVAAVTGRNTYDLVKIDVERFEHEVLTTLRDIKAKYLFIEASGQGRARNYSDAQLYNTIRNTMATLMSFSHPASTTEASPTSCFTFRRTKGDRLCEWVAG
jgi:FkbM family methyltransferase